MLRFS